MKYIRTKKGIYHNQGYFIVHSDEILKQADTIEELCDEFVFVDNRDNDHDLSIFGFEGARDDLFSTPRCKEIELYGAIWTDKGLIYVAKMNEKGDLELI